jgi:type II secretory pathway component PulK
MIPKVQRGFILVATLWILAVITIAAAYFAERVGRTIEQTRQKQETTEQLVEFSNTRADVLFRLGTTTISLFGLGEQPGIGLDNRAYRGSGSDIVRLQDERGLLSVNFVDPNLLTRFLGELGVPAEKRGPMIDTLMDYTDADDLRRLNGAEAAEYAALGLPPPPNELLATPYQLKNIIGWRDQAGLWENQRLTSFITTSRVNGFNPNTAPVELLASLPGSNRDIADVMVKIRKDQPLRNIAQFVGGPQDSDSFLYFPGNSMRITHQSQKFRWAVQYSLTLMPTSEVAPWRIDYHVKTTVPYPTENVDKLQKLPAQTSAQAADDQAF